MQLYIKNYYLLKASCYKQMIDNYKKLKQLDTYHETNIYDC